MKPKKEKQLKYRLTSIEIWGTKKVKPKDVQKLLKIKIGDFFTPQEIKLINRKAENIFRKDPLFSNAMMPRYKSKGATCLTLDFKNPKSRVLKKIYPVPQKDIRLPNTINNLYENYWKESLKCFSSKKRSINYCRKDGYLFSEDRKKRKYEEAFIEVAEKKYPLLKKVAIEDKNPEKRALATYILGWHHPTKDLVKVLQYNFYDPDFGVQNNAAIALSPSLDISLRTKKFNVPITPIFDLLAMPSGLSRNKALALLYQYAAAGKNLKIIAAKAGKMIKKAAKSKQLNHRDFAVLILGILREKNLALKTDF